MPNGQGQVQTGMVAPLISMRAWAPGGKITSTGMRANRNRKSAFDQ
jgi:hypothetical protein